MIEHVEEFKRILLYSLSYEALNYLFTIFNIQEILLINYFLCLIQNLLYILKILYITIYANTMGGGVDNKSVLVEAMRVSICVICYWPGRRRSMQIDICENYILTFTKKKLYFRILQKKILSFVSKNIKKFTLTKQSWN